MKGVAATEVPSQASLRIARRVRQQLTKQNENNISTIWENKQANIHHPDDRPVDHCINDVACQLQWVNTTALES